MTMKNTKLKYILLVWFLSFVTIFGGCSMSQETTDDVSHESVQIENEANEPKAEIKEKALLSYQEILKAAPAIEGEHEQLADASFDYEQNLELFGNHYDLYAFYDINKDEIPELIALTTVNFRWSEVSVYTFADGEAVLLKDPADPKAYGTFEQRSTANGSYITYFCEENHIHSVWRGTNPIGEAEEENHAYVLTGSILTEADCPAGISENTVYFSDIANVNKAEKTYAAAGSDAPTEQAFAGNWYEPVAQRGYCTVTVEDGIFKFLVSWNDSAAAYIWSFSGSPNKDGIINYTDCVKELHVWDENDEETVELIEENGCGSIWLAEENRMLWLEHLNDPEPSEFIRE